MARKAVPKPRLRKGRNVYEVREVIAGSVRTRSLETTDYKEAVRRFPDVYGDMLEEFENAADGAVVKPKHLTIAEVCRIRREQTLASEECFRQEHGRGTRAVGKNYTPEKLAAVYRERLERQLQSTRARWTVRDFEYEENFLYRLKMSGVGEVADAPAALRALVQDEIQTIRDIITADEQSGVPVTAAPVVESNAPKLSEYVETYLGQAKNVTASVALDIRAVVRDLIACTDDKSVDSYTREDGRVFREMILSLPANHTKLKATRLMSAPEAAQYARDNGLKPLASKTIRIKRYNLARLFKFAANDFDDVFNPFEETTTWNITTSKSAANQRDPFSRDELKTLFDSDVLEGDLRWLALLALYTGARPEELLQITAKHVRDGGTPHICFGPDLELKNEASVRSVPLHPRLIELGFLELVEKRRSGRILFPKMKPNEVKDSYSDATGKRFATRLKRLGIKRPGLSFYSFRHTWKAAWGDDPHTEARERLMGHAVAGVAGRYGNGYSGEANDTVLLEARADLMNNLEFGV